MRWASIFALAVGSLTACLVSIDESKLDAQPAYGDDDDDATKRDGGKTKLVDAGGGGLTDVLVEAAPIEAGVVLPASCKEALDQAASAASGPTTIGFQNQALTVYCDQTTRGGGWTMLHRLSAGPGLTGDPVAIYSSFGLHDTELAEITPKRSSAHYTSRLLNHWNVDFPVNDAMVRIYDDGGFMLKELVFNAGEIPALDLPPSTFMSFFVPDRMFDTSWPDLLKTVPFSDFTIQGSNDIGRRFNINRKYATCETDVGWLVAHGSMATVACDYELPSDYIRIYYAPGNSGRKWIDGVSDAASLAVFVR